MIRPKLLNYAGAVGDLLRLITRRTLLRFISRSSAFVLIAVAVDV